MKLIKSNLKKVYTLIYGNCTDSVQTMIEADKEHKMKSKSFDHEWILEKVKKIVSGLDTKVYLRVSCHTALIDYMLLKQYINETNDSYLSRFKSMVQVLKIAGGAHILVSLTLMGMEIEDATYAEIDEEKEKSMAVSYILRSNEVRYKKLLDGLRTSANLGRKEYPETLTDAFNLLVRESGEYDNIRQTNIFFRGRGGRDGRGGQGNHTFMFAQQGRDGRGNTEYTYTRTNEGGSDEMIAGTDGVTHCNVTCF